MATVTVSFTPLPAHVRTARFIAASVARRAGVAETVLDEVRLAVSEACSVAVRLHRARGFTDPVQLRLTDDADVFRIEVADAVPRARPSDDIDAPELAFAVGRQADDLHAFAPDDDAGPVDLRQRERIGLAVIVGLVDDVTVQYLDTGSVVTMCWPITDQAAVGSRPGSSTMF